MEPLPPLLSPYSLWMEPLPTSSFPVVSEWNLFLLLLHPYSLWMEPLPFFLPRTVSEWNLQLPLLLPPWMQPLPFRLPPYSLWMERLPFFFPCTVSEWNLFLSFFPRSVSEWNLFHYFLTSPVQSLNGTSSTTSSPVQSLNGTSSYSLPWYNRTGWLGVKHHIIYSLFLLLLPPYGLRMEPLASTPSSPMNGMELLPFLLPCTISEWNLFHVFHRRASEWNLLSKAISSAPSLESFHSRLDRSLHKINEQGS